MLNEDIQLGPGQQFLFDSLPIRYQLTEDAQGSRLLVRGEFARSGLATENKRVYPRALWEREIKKLAPKMAERKLLGELDHPKDGTSALTRASHIITAMEVSEDGTIIGEAEVLGTARGNDLRALLQQNCKVGISSRGYGSTQTNEKGEEVVQEDYNLVSFDFVADPADSTAYPDVVVSEAVQESVMGKKSEEEVATDLLAELGRINESARTQAREELLQDPGVAGARTALDEIKKILSPYLLTEDKDASVKISGLERQLQEQGLELSALKTQCEDLKALSRLLSYQLYTERRLQGNPDRSLAVKLLGDLKQYESAESLKSSLDGILSELSEQREAEAARVALEEAKMAKIRQEADAERRAVEEQNRKLQEDVNKLMGALEDSLAANKLASLRLYAQTRLAQHPDGSKIMKQLEARGFEDKDQIDEVIDEHRIPESSLDVLEQVRANARALTRGGRGRTPAAEEKPKARQKPLQENFNGTGHDLDSLLRLSGEVR